ncbi:MAG: hypothetical protein NVS4B8_14020 [Herpetosiphon sp.]
MNMHTRLKAGYDWFAGSPRHIGTAEGWRVWMLLGSSELFKTCNHAVDIGGRRGCRLLGSGCVWRRFFAPTGPFRLLAKRGATGIKGERLPRRHDRLWSLARTDAGTSWHPWGRRAIGRRAWFGSSLSTPL